MKERCMMTTEPTAATYKKIRALMDKGAKDDDTM